MSSEEQDIPFGRYLLRRRLGSGGMAEVYLAEMTGTAGFQRLVALKRILPHLGDDEEFIDSFISEARLGGSLNHPNIVQTLELGREAGQYFLAMEFVDGMTLAQLLRARRERGEALPLSIALEIASRLCEALQYAHTATDVRGTPLRMIHRDLKPDNVLLGRHGEVKLTDFGVAKASTARRQTLDSSVVKGTVAYMSPEQAHGFELDPRSDLYSLGSILYEMVTLEALYPDAKGFPGLFLVQKGEVIDRLKRLEMYPAPFVSTMNKLLQSERTLRHTSAQELRFELISLVPMVPSSLFTLGDVVQQALQARESRRNESWRVPLSGGSEQTLRPAGSDVHGESMHSAPRSPSHPSLSAVVNQAAASGKNTRPSTSPSLPVYSSGHLNTNPATGSTNPAAGAPSASPPRSGSLWGDEPDADAMRSGGFKPPQAATLLINARPGEDVQRSPSSPSVKVNPAFPETSRAPSQPIPPLSSDARFPAASKAPADPRQGFSQTSRVPPTPKDEEVTATGPIQPIREEVKPSAAANAVREPVAPARNGNTGVLAAVVVGVLVFAGLVFWLTRERTEVIADTGNTQGSANPQTSPQGQIGAETGANTAGNAAGSTSSAGGGAVQPSPGTVSNTSDDTRSNGSTSGSSGPGATGTTSSTGAAATTNAGSAPTSKPTSKPATEPTAVKPVVRAPTPPPDKGSDKEPDKGKPTAKPILRPGFVTVNSRPFAYVSANGRSLGETPLVRAELPAGKYTLTFKTEEGQTQKVQVDIKAGEETKLPPVLF